MRSFDEQFSRRLICWIGSLKYKLKYSRCSWIAGVMHNWWRVSCSNQKSTNNSPQKRKHLCTRSMSAFTSGLALVNYANRSLFKLYIITFRFTEACISSKGTNSNRAADSDRMNGAASTSRRDDRRGFGPVRGDRGFDNRAPPYQGGFERYRGGFGRGGVIDDWLCWPMTCYEPWNQ